MEGQEEVFASQSCCAKTKKGSPCLIDADRQRDGEWYCHLHDPMGMWHQQRRAKHRGEHIPTRKERMQALEERVESLEQRLEALELDRQFDLRIAGDE